MRGEGAMPVLETAYRLDLDERAWLTEIARVACGTLGDPGLVAAGAIIRSHDEGFDYELRVVDPHDDDFMRAVDSIEAMQPKRVNAVKYRTTRVGTASDLAVWNHMPAGMAKLLLGWKLGRWGTREVIQVQGAVLDDLTVGVTASLRAPQRSTPWLRHTWARVGVHLAAGLRLRRALRQGPPILARADLVLEQNGAVAHASPVLADDNDLLETLREHARAVDHARGALSRDAPEKAVELWAGLFAGRWSLLETFDSDGRAYVVACENEPEVRETRVLTRRERQVAELAAEGHGDDFVAYTLGISAATVQTHLQRALAKMGIDSRARLVRTHATLRARLDKA